MQKPSTGLLRPIAVIAGMEAELAALGPARNHPRIRTAVSGASPDRAEDETHRLIAAGCGLVISWGIAGGLDPALAPGALLGGIEVVAEDGSILPLADARIPGARAARLVGLDRPAMTADEKAGLRAATGAIAVDMETHRIARAAAALGVPVMAIRAVGDPAGRALPRLAADALGPDGRPRIARVILGLVVEPWALPTLFRLRRDTDAALAALEAVAAALPGLRVPG